MSFYVLHIVYVVLHIVYVDYRRALGDRYRICQVVLRKSLLHPNPANECTMADEPMELFADVSYLCGHCKGYTANNPYVMVAHWRMCQKKKIKCDGHSAKKAKLEVATTVHITDNTKWSFQRLPGDNQSDKKTTWRRVYKDNHPMPSFLNTKTSFYRFADDEDWFPFFYQECKLCPTLSDEEYMTWMTNMRHHFGKKDWKVSTWSDCHYIWFHTKNTKLVLQSLIPEISMTFHSSPIQIVTRLNTKALLDSTKEE
jgi:hypothetical protein